jgi:hypothetical protein
MSILYPAMLAGLLGLALPVLFHLIARQRFPVQMFPSIRLLFTERRHNAFARRLIDRLQLLLRLLLILLLALAMARPFLPGLGGRPAARNLVVIIDATASMRTRVSGGEGETPLEAARVVAARLLREVQAPGYCALLLAGDELRLLSPLSSDPGPALAALQTIEVGDGSGPGLFHALARAAELVGGRKEVLSQIVVLTDGRAAAFAARNRRDLETLARIQRAMGNKLVIDVVDLGGEAIENVSLVNAELVGGQARVGDDALLWARLRNDGPRPVSGLLRSTMPGAEDTPARGLTLEPGEHVAVALGARVNRGLQSFARVVFDNEDAFPDDNLFLMPFTVSRPRRVLLVGGVGDVLDRESATLSGMGTTDAGGDLDEPVDGARILQFALNPGRELGLGFGTGIEVTRISPEALPAQTLGSYALIVLYDVSQVPVEVVEDLRTFVEDGKALLFICGGGVNPVAFNGTFFAREFDLAPIMLGNEVNLEQPLGIAVGEAGTHAVTPGAWLGPLQATQAGDFGIVRFLRVRDARELASDAIVRMRGTDGRPLAVEVRRGRGRTMALQFGLELSRGNLAMTRIFPAVMWRLIDDLTGELDTRPSDTLVSARPAVVAADDGFFAAVDHLLVTREIEDAAEETVGLIPKTAQERVLLPRLAAGRYWLQRPRATEASPVTSYRRPLAVNLDRRESNIGRIDPGDLRAQLGDTVHVVQEAGMITPVPAGIEIWYPLVWLLLVLYALEALRAYLEVKRRREKETELPGAEEEVA